MGDAPTSYYYVGIIDGTGPNENEDYDFVMKASPGHAGGFCWQLFVGPFTPRGSYMRGPHDTGSGLERAVTKIYVASKTAYSEGRDIVLVGYSRGALGCLIVAERLKNEDIPIHTMVLLDPVDRYAPSTPFQLVPRNVKASFRAYRKLSAAVVLRYEGTIPTIAPNEGSTWTNVVKRLLNTVMPSNPIRPMFSRAAQGIERGPGVDTSDHPVFEYVGTHGAMGGCGYEWVREDRYCQDKLIRDLTGWLRHRVDVKFKLVPNYDPVLTSSYMKQGGFWHILAASGGAAVDLALMTIERVDFLGYKLKELATQLLSKLR